MWVCLLHWYLSSFLKVTEFSCSPALCHPGGERGGQVVLGGWLHSPPVSLQAMGGRQRCFPPHSPLLLSSSLSSSLILTSFLLPHFGLCCCSTSQTLNESLKSSLLLHPLASLLVTSGFVLRPLPVPSLVVITSMMAHHHPCTG